MFNWDIIAKREGTSLLTFWPLYDGDTCSQGKKKKA